MPNHDFMGCPHKDAYPEHVAEQVNAFNNFQRPRNDPYSNFYNPGWRDHPNMKWGGNQQVQPFQQNHIQQPVVQPKRSLEDTLQMFMQSTKQYIDKNDQNMQNVQASIQNLEKQFGQLASHIMEREKGKFPSQTVPNPRGSEACNAVRILRCGKSYDNRENAKSEDHLAENPAESAE
ncbi:hypothetical protein ACFX13_037261 [Malus domestica]